MWQARVDSIKPLFEEARIYSGKSEIDAEVVKKVWDKIAPAMASQFDAPYSVPPIAPRPLLLNGVLTTLVAQSLVYKNVPQKLLRLMQKLVLRISSRIQRTSSTGL
uniref:Uncharacterized protein n=1 Tax=Aegilops tauschii subsp. strangulata TaxID=200361 RepID=A0A453QRR8_AEGTS